MHHLKKRAIRLSRQFLKIQLVNINKMKIFNQYNKRTHTKEQILYDSTYMRHLE